MDPMKFPVTRALKRYQITQLGGDIEVKSVSSQECMVMISCHGAPPKASDVEFSMDDIKSAADYKNLCYTAKSHDSIH